MGTSIVIPAVSNPAVSLAAVDISAVNVNVPAVVASGIHAAQAANLNLTNIYTPSNTGIYRISLGAQYETSDSSVYSIELSYADQDGNNQSYQFDVPFGGQPSSGVFLFYPKSGSAIELLVSWSSGTYDFTYVLEAF